MKCVTVKTSDLEDRWDVKYHLAKNRLKESMTYLESKYSKKEVLEILGSTKPRFKRAIEEICTCGRPTKEYIECEIKKNPYLCLALVQESLLKIKEEVKKEQEELKRELDNLNLLRNL